MNIYFGENLKNLRKQKNLTQERLAEFLGVSFQTVSKWERGDTYPDITILPEIASFFRVSVDELLGVNRAEDEEEITSKLREYDNLTDGKMMTEIITPLKKKFPNDFRVLIRYLACLVHFSEDETSVDSEIKSIYNNIQENCTNDKIRIKAKRAMIEHYRNLYEINKDNLYMEKCQEIINEMPDMRDSREMFSFYPEDSAEKDENIRNTLEEQFLLLNTVYSHYFHYNGFFYDRRFSDEWVISAFQKELDFLNFVYDDGNYGKMWCTVMYNYGHLGVRYAKLGENEKAIENFRKMCSLAIEFDSMDTVTTMHSVMFEGKKFDKNRLGSTYNAKSRIKQLLLNRYPLSDEFKATDEFKEIIKMVEE